TDIDKKIKEKSAFELDFDLDKHHAKLDDVDAERLKHKQFKPNWVEAILTRRAAYKKWVKKDEILQDEYCQIKQSINAHREKLYALEESIKQLKKEFDQVPALLDEISK